MRLMISVLLLALFSFSCGLQEDVSIPDGGHPTTVTEPGFAAQMLSEVNALRESGCRCGARWMPPAPPLSWNGQLARSAQRHADDMQRNDFFSHKGSDGSTMAQRISEAGYPWKQIGENIAWGYPDIRSVVQGWQDSPGHCENMMNAAYTEMGAARAGEYWVQDLGRR